MLVLLILYAINEVSSRAPVPTTLAQSQACYYQPFHKHLACQCGEQGVEHTYLSIKMEYWVRDMGQEVGSILPK